MLADSYRSNPFFFPGHHTEIYCPQPQRTVPSCHHPKHKKPSIFNKGQNEACKEIEQILKRAPERFPEGTLKRTFSPPTAVTPFGQNNNLEEIVTMNEEKIDLSSSSDGLPSVFLNASLTQSKPSLKRPKLGGSCTYIPGLLQRTAPQPIPTPPIRTQNPIPMNSTFSNKGVPLVEFGLLSVSPPRDGDEDFDMLERRERLHRTKFSHSYRRNELASDAGPREDTCDNIFGHFDDEEVLASKIA